MKLMVQVEPLLLLHGNRSPISSFHKQIPEFSKYFKLIAVDTRGQGKSTEDAKAYTYDLFGEDMNTLLDHL
ncbi:MAG: alpha/beta hydrolase [Chitinophagaceae bacterium]